MKRRPTHHYVSRLTRITTRMRTSANPDPGIVVRRQIGWRKWWEPIAPRKPRKGGAK